MVAARADLVQVNGNALAWLLAGVSAEVAITRGQPA